jgi:hypothetical protein
MSVFLSAAYRFKPGRTFAQALAAALVADGTDLVNTPWPAKLALAGMAGAVSLLQIWGEGGDLFADDARVTGSKGYDLIARH